MAKIPVQAKTLGLRLPRNEKLFYEIYELLSRLIFHCFFTSIERRFSEWQKVYFVNRKRTERMKTQNHSANSSHAEVEKAMRIQTLLCVKIKSLLIDFLLTEANSPFSRPTINFLGKSREICETF